MGEKIEFDREFWIKTPQENGFKIEPTIYPMPEDIRESLKGFIVENIEVLYEGMSKKAPGGAKEKMILTFKIKHGRDFSSELRKAKQIAEFAIKTHAFSSKDVKQFGLKGIISNQILRKYSRNKKIKGVKHVVLTIPNQGIKVDKEKREIYIPCLKLTLNYNFRNDFEKVNQIEIDEQYAYISVTIPEKPAIEPKVWLGVDRNTTGHIAVIANPQTGKVYKLGKKAEHVHRKYSNIRRELQKAKKYRLLKKIKNREQRIIMDLNHKISKKIVEIATEQNAGIKLEKLGGIRNNKKHAKSFNYVFNSWSFYQLQKFIEYKAKLEGIPITYVEPRDTSKECSRCGSIGIREGKSFKCTVCGHVDHADANASFNIALRPPSMEGVGRLYADRDAYKGSTDTPRWATPRKTETQEPPKLWQGDYIRENIWHICTSTTSKHATTHATSSSPAKNII